MFDVYCFNDKENRGRKRETEGFANMSSGRQTKQGRSSYRLVREQRMLATDNDDETVYLSTERLRLMDNG